MPKKPAVYERGFMAYTNSEMIACIEREIRMRMNGYPRWVRQGKLTQSAADHELGCMRGVLAVLTERGKTVSDVEPIPGTRSALDKLFRRPM